MFPKAQKATIDWGTLNEEVLGRKDRLMAQA
jgi:hypothetical protein